MDTSPLRRLSNPELQPYAKAGNAFSQIEHARSVARAREGAEAIVKEGEHYVLYAASEQLELNSLASQGGQRVLEFVDSHNQSLSIVNREGLKGVGERLNAKDLKPYASAGNAFANFTHAEAVARKLNQDTAIVAQNGVYQLYALTPDSAQRLRNGQNDLLDGKVSAVVRSGQTLYNWGADRAAATPHTGFAYVEKGKLMLDQQPFTIRGLNVYSLADVAQQGDAELRKTLQLIADSGANTVRFWAFTQHNPEDLKKIFETSRDMNLPLKFIPVLGNHWEHVEAQHSRFTKDSNWYQQGFEQHYWPHAEATVKALLQEPDILMWELMNEPEGSSLRGFADEVSTRIRKLYSAAEAESGQPTARHLIGLGTLGVGHWGDERPGMRGHDYKDLYGLPNIDVATAHDYTSDTLEGSIADFMAYARDLNKPFFLGEIGVKVRKGGTEQQPQHSPLSAQNPEHAKTLALQRLKEKVQASVAAGSAGAMLWGPQPGGHGVDGDGYGFSYDQQSTSFPALKDLFAAW